VVRDGDAPGETTRTRLFRGAAGPLPGVLKINVKVYAPGDSTD
jgi:hypothetical protein